MKKFRKLVIVVLLVVFPFCSAGCFAPIAGYGLMTGLAYLGVGALGTYLIMDKVREEKEPEYTPTPYAIEAEQLEWKKVQLEMEEDIAGHWDYAVDFIRSRGTKIVEKGDIVMEIFKRDGYVVINVRKGKETLDAVKVKCREGKEKRAIGAALKAL